MITIDTEKGIVSVQHGAQISSYGMGTPEAFALLSQVWIKSSWENKYAYSFTWMGRPVIQLPEDMIRLQEVIYSLQPDVIIETGVAHGGSLIFYASLCKAMEKGRVIGIDIEIRPHNRAALEDHPLFPFITLFEGSSIEAKIVAQVRDQVQPGEKVLVLLDSCHTKAHVLAELQAYGPLVTPGSYIVATDGIMQDVVGAARAQADWSWNNPQQAALEFVEANEDFQLEEPTWRFNESHLAERVTYWPSAFIKRLR